ncbi:MAG: cobyrinate a,c-diamide synthase [Candidatus Promineifilaceae bacterium]
MIPSLMLAAPESGSGKTTITSAIIAALTKQGLTVQPFKVGPDYIDPTYHTIAAQRTCRNLDSWMLGKEAACESFVRNCQGADVAIVEGVMGLFDGFGVLDNEGSSAEIATLLDIPIVLVMNARGMARSAAALVKGYHTFSPNVKLSGVILNRVGSPRHAAMCQQAIEAETGVPVLGYVLRNQDLVLPERHLGLIPTAEKGDWHSFIQNAAGIVANTIDLDRLLTVSNYPLSVPRYPLSPPPASPDTPHPKVRIALADDEAFSFTYPENVELLEEAGAEIVRFSPLHDATVPDNVQGLILVGGFPELYAHTLSENRPMLNAIRTVHAKGIPIYAECGGLMVLTEMLYDKVDNAFPMVGLLSGNSRMTARVKLGYRTVTALADGPVLAKGEQMRGHEFHYSLWENRPKNLPHAYHIESRAGGNPTTAGAILGNIWASYIHLHFLANRNVAQRFVHWCAEKASG